MLIVPAVIAAALWLGPPPPEPGPAHDLKPAVYRYRGRVRSAGSTIDVNSVLTVADDGPAWKITHKVNGRNFDFVQTTRVEKRTLRVLDHDLKRGSLAAVAQASEDAVKGRTIAPQRPEKAFTVDLDEPLFADGAALIPSVAALPLQEDFRTEFLNLDFTSGETYVVEVEVLGTERVQCPSGMFTAYKVRVNPQDGIRDQFLWISKDSRKPVRVRSRLPLGEAYNVDLAP